MYLWKKEYERPTMYGRSVAAAYELEAALCLQQQGVVYKRHECEWVLPENVAKHIRYNPRHLPVVIKPPDNEYYYLRMAIARVIRGWTSENWTLPTITWRD